MPINNYFKCEQTKLSNQKTEQLSGLKNKNQLYVAYKRLTLALRIQQTESERIEKVIHANGNQKKARAAALISDKMKFKTKPIRDKKVIM